MKLLAAVVVCVTFIGLGRTNDKPAPTNLVVNGSFEDGPADIKGEGKTLSQDFGYLPLDKGSTAITGWLVTRGPIDLHANHAKAAKGRRSIDLNGSPGVGGIQQTVPTVEGKRYVLRFMLSGHPGRLRPEEAFQSPEPEKTMRVALGDETHEFTFDTTGRNRAEMGWREKKVEFTARSNETVLEFYSVTEKDMYFGPDIDDVRMYAAD